MYAKLNTHSFSTQGEGHGKGLRSKTFWWYGFKAYHAEVVILMWHTYLPSQQTDPSLWGLLCEWPLSFDAPLAEVELPLHPILMVWEIPPLWTSWSTCFAHIWPRAKHQEMRGQKCQKLSWPVSSRADSRLWLDHTCVRTACPIPLYQLGATGPHQ